MDHQRLRDQSISQSLMTFNYCYLLPLAWISEVRDRGECANDRREGAVGSIVRGGGGRFNCGTDIFPYHVITVMVD